MFEFTQGNAPEFEEAFLEALAEETENSDSSKASVNSYVDFTKMNLPKEMMSVLNTRNSNVKLETVETSNADVSSVDDGDKVKKEQEEAKTAALFRELEDALNSKN